MSVICNVIIPQIDPKTQEAIDKLQAKMQGIQDSEPMKQLKAWSEQYNNKLQEIPGYSAMVKQAKTASEAWNGVQVNSVMEALKEKLQVVVSPEVQEKLDQAKRNAELFNEQIKVMLEAAVVVVEKTVVNIYKKIVSCSRTPRSHNRASSLIKSSKGDSGDSDPDQPEPPRHTCTSTHPHLIPHIPPKRNKLLYSRRLASCGCLMAQGVA